MNTKYIIILAVTLVIYFILDVAFKNAALYIISGVVGGSIGEAFKLIGIKAEVVLISLIWVLILTGLVVAFYKLDNNIPKYLLIVLIAGLLYVIDFSIANIPYAETNNTNQVVLISKIVVGFLVLIKSIILSRIIYTGLLKS